MLFTRICLFITQNTHTDIWFLVDLIRKITIDIDSQSIKTKCYEVSFSPLELTSIFFSYYFNDGE